MELSIIIVNYNTFEFTLKCIESIYNQTKNLNFEILVVDNNSKKNEAEKIKKYFPKINLFALKENLGFAGANNFAAKKALGEYLLLLNPDTVVLDNAITKLYNFAVKNKEYGIFGGRTFFPDGSLNPTSCWGKPTLWSHFCASTGLSAVFRRSFIFEPESLGKWQRNTIREVDIITGCFLLIKKKNWDVLRGFDTRYFMYGEDADLCLRAKKRG